MSSTRTMGIAVTDVSTEQQLPLGFEYHEPAGPDDTGPKVWIYVQMKADPTVVGSVCSFNAAATTYTVRKVPANTHACTVVGVAQHVIAADSFGFILRRGVGEVLADGGGVTANEGLMVGDAAGTADVAGAVTTESFGTAQETVASALATCWINCRG